MNGQQLEIPAHRRTGVLGEPNMRWYLGGQLISLTGTMLQSGVLLLLIITLTNRSNAAFWSGLVWALGLIPGCLFGPFGGILLDKVDKRKVLIITGALGTFQALVFFYLTYTHTVAMWEIVVLATIMGFVNAVDGPGRNVIVKDAVLDKNNVRAASKMFTSLYNLAQVAGPGFAGYLVLHFGYPVTFLLNALSFVVLIGALVKMRFVPPVIRTASEEQEKKKSVWTLVREGKDYCLSHQVILLATLMTALLCAFGFSYYAILAVIAREMFHGGPVVYSHFAMASGIGSFLAATIIIKFDEQISHKLLVTAGSVITGVALFLLSVDTNVDCASSLLFCVGFGFMASFSSLRSSIIHHVKEELSGIVMGFGFSFFFGGALIGSFGAGFFASRFGCPVVLEVCGVVLVLVAIITPFLPGINDL